MSDMQRQYQDSSKMMARAMLHIKYGPPGKVASLADTGLITAGAKVLDVGCGPGRFWAVSAQTLPPGIDLTLADLSPGMVDEAVKNVTGANGTWRAVTGRQADVGALPFADDGFDIVTAMHMLYHAPDKNRAVAEIARVLKPGGLLIATTNGADALKELTDLTQAVFGPQPKDFGHASFSLETGEPILKRHFREVTVHPAADILRVTDAQDVVNYVCSFPPGDGAPEPLLAKLKSELAARMAAQGGIFAVTRIVGYLVARRPRR